MLAVKLGKYKLKIKEDKVKKKKKKEVQAREREAQIGKPNDLTQTTEFTPNFQNVMAKEHYSYL